MDPLRLCIALGPLAVYLLVIGAVNLRKRPFVITGARDTAALGVGVSGMLLVGPIELLLPPQTIDRFGANGWMLWGMIIVMYALVLSLWVMLARPRITIYNTTLDTFRPVLAEALDVLEAEPRWAGNSVCLARLGVELHMEATPAMRNVTLAAAGEQQNYAGWRLLEHAIRARLRTVEARPNAWGAALAALGLLLLGRMSWELATQSEAIVAALRDMLRL